MAPIPIVIPPLAVQDKAVEIYQGALLKQEQKEQQAATLLASIDGYLLDELGITLPEQDNSLEKRMFRISSREVSGGRFDSFYNAKHYTEKHYAIAKGNFSFGSLGSVSTSLGNGKEFREYANTGFRYLRVSDLGKYEISNHNPRYIEIDAIPTSIRLTKNDFLISRSGSLGLVSVVTDEVIDSVLSSHIFKLGLNVKVVTPHYLEGYLRSTLGQFQFFQKNNGGVIPELNQSALKSIVVVVPPLSVQQKIANHIQSIRTQATQLQTEAAQVLADAKAQVERMILGEG